MINGHKRSALFYQGELWTTSRIYSSLTFLLPSDNQASALCKQMFTLALDILNEDGKTNLISTGRALGKFCIELNHYQKYYHQAKWEVH